MKRILIVAGTRPEIIKLAPVILAAKERTDTVQTTLCLTGQHVQLARQALEIFDLQPDVSLDIMRPNQTLNDIAAAVFQKLPPVIAETRPDVLLVQGDTTTAAIAAQTAFHLRVPVGHVEAGLRSHDLTAPFPEEYNRRIISTFARFNFCPTQGAAGQLRREGISSETIYITGNTVVDAVRLIVEGGNLGEPFSVDARIRPPFVLVTAHRRESFGEGFRNICAAIRECAERFADLQFVYPVHLNPNVQAPVRSYLDGIRNILLIDPVPYLSLLRLLGASAFVLTDSGGIQEEAPSFGKYCIVMREKTERMESVEMGISELVGSNQAAIVSAVERQVSHPVTVRRTENPYGDGHASERIITLLARGL